MPAKFSHSPRALQDAAKAASVFTGFEVATQTEGAVLVDDAGYNDDRCFVVLQGAVVTEERRADGAVAAEMVGPGGVVNQAALIGPPGDLGEQLLGVEVAEPGTVLASLTRRRFVQRVVELDGIHETRVMDEMRSVAARRAQARRGEGLRRRFGLVAMSPEEIATLEERAETRVGQRRNLGFRV